MSSNEIINKTILQARSNFQDTYIIHLASVLFLSRLEVARPADPAIETIFERFRNDIKQCADLDLSTPQHRFQALLFVSLISALELFFQEIITVIITAYPKKIGSAQFRLSEILDAGSTDELVSHAAEEYTMKLMYKKPFEYLDEISNILSIDSSAVRPFWPAFIEAKARRDLGIHNGWRCNSTYIRKLLEAGISSSLQIGEDAFPSDSDYMNDVANALNNISRAITTALVEKYFA
jgi:hypothetical protein